MRKTMTELDNSVQRVDATIKQIETSVEHVDSAIHGVDSSIQEVGSAIQGVDSSIQRSWFLSKKHGYDSSRNKNIQRRIK